MVSTQQDKKKSWNAIMDAYTQELTACVIELCHKHLQIYSKHGPAWLIYGEALYEMKRFSDAVEALQKAIALCPEEKQYQPYVWLGHVYKDMGQYQQAESWYRKALTVAPPDDADFWIFLASNYFYMGDIQQAEENVRKAIVCSEGRRDEAYYNLGGYLLVQQRYEEAEQCYQHALELDPDYEVAKLRLKDVQQVLVLLQSEKASS